MVLLTVSSLGEEKVGGTADLYLELKPGQGRIFLDSFPLTKLDTQISTRFANQIACQTVGKDCSKWDFFYTIKADSSIVGGPSASSSAAVITAALISGLSLNQSVAMTGTINSGGIIGPVAGVYQKVLAAQRRGLKKVLIPKWVSFNESRFKEETGEELKVEVVKVGNLEEALEEFTGARIETGEAPLNVSEKYLDRMRAVSDIICDRTAALAEEAGVNESEMRNFTLKKSKAYNQSRYYTVASYCFTKNVELKKRMLEGEKKADLLWEL